MSDILCVTNRILCRETFLLRLEKIASNKPAGIILREKDLPEPAYRQLAQRVLQLCNRYHIPCILHSFIDIAIELETEAIHLPLCLLQTMSHIQRERFKLLGASCHSIDDAKKAQQLGCTYITAGHIFATDCKRGVPGRGIDFLRDICRSVPIPVYAIGGINCDNIKSVRQAGAKGACIMSGLMQCDDVSSYLSKYEKAGETNAY